MELEALRNALLGSSLPEAERAVLLNHLAQLEKQQQRLEFQLARLREDKDVLNRLLNKTSEDLGRAVERAESANRAKSAFLATMSHELRTPLNAIIGYTDLLIDQTYGELNDAQRDRLQRVISNGQHLLGLINDILDLSKIEAGKEELHPEQVPLDAFLRQLKDAARPMAAQNNNLLHMDMTEDAGSIYTDLIRLRQILFNLLSNACKFTSNGKITVAVARLYDEDGSEWLRFIVADTGIGMTEEQVSRIFKEFEQGDSSTTRMYGGTGLGLTITHRLCQMMGGSIEVNSRLGEGSIFTVMLPAQVRV